MCGIAGLSMAPGAAPPDGRVLARLAAAIAHRGPDGGGQSVVGRVALVHARLAIVDVAGGDQPLSAGPATLVANGEIYNDPALRQEFAGVRFATHSDCEPPLQLWLRDGPEYARGLRGMYAIALHDRSDRSLVLSRDPFGIKPLYFASIDGGIAFASEPQALLAAGLIRRGTRRSAMRELLQMQFTTGAETIFPGISRVLPGETLCIVDGHLVDRRRQAALPAEAATAPASEDAAMATLGAALMDSVAAHRRIDVPYGLFLSGGIDSAAVLAAMARLDPAPVHAFTAGFDAPGAADERAAASALARAAGARHEAIEIGQAQMWRHLPQIVAAMDDPAADYAIIPTWFLARHAAGSVKVVLSGEGGDEMLAGYGRYRSAMRPWWRGGRIMRGRGNFDRLDVLRDAPAGWRDGFVAAEARVALPGRSRLQAAQAADTEEWLPNDLLIKLDRCLMAHGVEGRTPFLDPRVAAAAFPLPDALKVRGGMGKMLLRRWLAEAIPAARPFAPKQGFTVPVGAWIAAEGERLGPMVARQPGIEEIAHPDRVVALFRAASGKREGMAAWVLLFVALWHQAHVVGGDVSGGVFDTL